MMTPEEVIKTENRYVMQTYSRIPIVLSEGSGMYVKDVEGHRFLDMVAGIAVLSLGYGHPAMVETLSAQAAKLVHTSNLYYTEEQAVLAEKLVKTAFPGKVFFSNSGAEANEAAFKIARKHGALQEKKAFAVISAIDSFHGRTLATLAATGQPEKQKMFGPMPVGFKSVKFNDAPALEDAIDEDTCAVILEPIQGEGGVITARREYLQDVRRICDHNGLLLILDEVQTGVARTGDFYAYKDYGIKPDIVTLAKGLGGGVPIGATLVSERIASELGPGDHGTTFGGSPLVCAAAGTVIDTIERESLAANAASVGEHLKRSLRSIGNHTRFIKEVRGRGLMLGIELDLPVAAQVQQECLDRGVIVNKIRDDIIRILPPLIIGKQEADEFLGVFKEALDSAAKGFSEEI